MKGWTKGRRSQEPVGRPGSSAGCLLLSAVLLLGMMGSVLAQEAVFRRAETGAGPPPIASPTPAALAEQLQPTLITEFVTLEYTETPAEDVIAAISRDTGKTIVWGPEAETGAEPKKGTRVTVQARNAPWRGGLTMVLDQIGGVVIEETPSRVLIDTPQPVTAVWVEDDLKFVIETIGRLANASIIVGPNVEGTVTARVVNQPWTRALDDVVRTAGFITVREGNVIRVVHPATLQAQLVTKVFRLNYVMPPDTYRPTIDSEYLSGGPMSRSDARRAVAGGGTGYQATFTGQLGAPPARAPAGGGQVEEVEFPLFDAVRRVLTPTVGQVTYNPDQNAFIVTDTEPVLKQVEQVLAYIDTEPEQVFVDVKFVTISGPIAIEGGPSNITDLMEFGVDWSQGIWASHTGPAGIPSDFPWAGQHPGIGTAAATPGTLSFAQLQTVLQLLKSDGNVEIVQAPKLTVLDHQEATIFVGETVRFAETVSASNQQGAVELAAQEATNSPLDTGFQILIVPHIVPGSDKVIVTLIPERNTLEGFDLYEFGVDGLRISLPRVSSDTVVTKMLLRDKGTAVIGGLIDESDEERVNKVPFLGDIPGLGWLFKRQTIVKTRRNLIIFVTVHIIRRSQDSRDVYRSYRDYDTVSAEYFTPWDLDRRRRLEAEEKAKSVSREAEEALGPGGEQPAWRQTPEGIEYSVPAKGAQEEQPLELQLTQ